jgi:hypothetical protein
MTDKLITKRRCKLNLPGFTAEASIVQNSTIHGYIKAARTMSGVIEPALEVRYKKVCWCVEGDLCEEKTWWEKIFGLPGRLYECCVREECVSIPIFS